MIPDFSILVAVDREHLAELAVSYPTWIRHKPELRDRPIVVVIDEACLFDEVWRIVSGHVGKVTTTHVIHNREHSQREKMLAAFVFDGPHEIETPYYLKLDTDCIATGEPNWIDPAWFDGEPVIVAPNWGYTKPAMMLPQLDFWAAEVPAIADKTTPKRRIVGNVAKYKRIISYCMFGRTDWTREVASWCKSGRLPCPSQDTFLHYCAARSGALWRAARMPGWRHVGGGGMRLREAAKEAMGEGAAA